MKYDMGGCLADYGFSFLERVHEPIFLVNSSGALVKINESGRKFLHVAHVNQKEIETLFQSYILHFSKGLKKVYQRIPIGKGLQLVARHFPGSEMIMVEIVRTGFSHADAMWDYIKHEPTWALPRRI